MTFSEEQEVRTMKVQLFLQLWVICRSRTVYPSPQSTLPQDATGMDCSPREDL